MSTWQWPNNARAAVSLTYDDGNGNNLDNAMPDLEAAGFRGTFYLQTSRRDMQQRMAEWRAAALRGHEMGNHTVHHWCRADVYLAKLGKKPDWMERSLEDVTPAEIAAEVAAAAAWLNENIGPDHDRTFAYPCGAVAIGEEPDEASYDVAITAHCFAARTCIPEVNNPATLNLLRLGAFGGSGANPAPLIAHCEAALACGGWTVLYFHGIGGPSHVFERAAHQALIAHLKAGNYWVAPVQTVGRYVEQVR